MAGCRIIKKFRGILKKAVKSQFFRAKFRFVRYSEKYEIDENLALFEAFMGNDFTGNPFYVFEHLCTNKEYDNIQKVIAVNKAHLEKVTALIEKYGYTENVKIIKRNTIDYCKVLTTAKYLVNNVSFPTYFVKREGQILLNTWHGTPLKGLGRNIKDNPNSIGNVQRNFLMCDYLLYPNRYSYEHIKDDYMLEQFYRGDYVLSGYPCNSKFFENKNADAIRSRFGLENKRVIVYMPTWRDQSKKGPANKQIYYMMHAFCEMESKLDDNTVVFVKLHHLAKGNVQLNGFTKIKEFPTDYETYDFLSIADALITDYSSVMFDFANTGKSIYLYTYDKEEYMAGRSVYFDMDELPFFSTDDIHALVNEIIADKTYDYSDFVKKFCTYDSKNAAKELTELMIYGRQSDNMEVIHGPDLFNGKENVLIYAGVLQKNGMTTAMKNLVNSIDASERNYVLTFYAEKTNHNKQLINEFQKGVMYMPMQGSKNLKVSEAFLQVLFYMNIKLPGTQKAIDKIYHREIDRLYPGIHFDHAIHFTGYEKHLMQLFARMDGTKKYIWVHNNMYKEAKTKKNFHIDSIKYAYDMFDKIVVVRETMKDELKSFMDENAQKKIVVVHNQNDLSSILPKSKLPVEFQNDTYCNVDIEKLNEVLADKNINKFINIARFSKEKGIDRLITAFDKYRKEYDNDAWLIIIGGYGIEFKNVKSMIVDENENIVTPNIILIKSIMNPYSILKQCNAFVLSSYYEGLPMTIIEALVLDVPVISTNITGPREFLEEGYGYLVDNSEQGLIDGFNAYKDKTMFDGLKKFDVNKFNKDAMDEFESVFEN